MANPLLEVKELSVSYGDVRALWDVSLTVEEGTIVALVGINGAGKSTLLKTISGLLHPRHGEILFEGEDFLRLSSKDRVDKGVVQVPEGRRLFQNLTIQREPSAGSVPSQGARQFRRVVGASLRPVPRAQGAAER